LNRVINWISLFESRGDDPRSIFWSSDQRPGRSVGQYRSDAIGCEDRGQKFKPQAGNIFKGQAVPDLGAQSSLLLVCGSTVFKEFIVMDEQLDRKQLQRKLILCRRLSETACDPATSSRLAKLIVELEHSLRQPN
jgi:hypothetical protein